MVSSWVLIFIPVTIRQVKIIFSKQSKAFNVFTLFPKGYKAHFHQMKPGEDFEDLGEMHDSRMEEERRHMKMFPEFRSWSKPTYPMRHTRSKPTRQTHTNPTDKTQTNPTHSNPTDRTQPRNTYDPPPRSEKAKTGENCKTFFKCTWVFPSIRTFEWLDSD